MRSMKFGLVAAAMVCGLSVTAQAETAKAATAKAADCKRVTALGETLTHDSAVLFSTNALKNTLASQGLVGKGEVKTTCKDGATTTTCHSTQMACKGGTPKACLGPWLCF